MPDWPAFPDSADALARLARHYQLIIVSNVHSDGFAGSNRQLRGDFAAVITAEDVGGYKPADNHFRALDGPWPSSASTVRSCCTSRRACSTITPSPSARGCGRCGSTAATTGPAGVRLPSPASEWSYDLEFPTMAAFADAVDAAFAGTPGAS